MKKHGSSFIVQLKDSVRSLKHIKPNEVHILSINAKYGHYQIVIGPAEKGDDDTRSIEINGEVHHLFVSPKDVRVHPSKDQIDKNLHDTVVMRDLTIHLKDPKGDGEHLQNNEKQPETIEPKECINLAGEEGEKLVKDATHSSRVSMATYRIIQEDIISSLKEQKGKIEDITEESIEGLD